MTEKEKANKIDQKEITAFHPAKVEISQETKEPRKTPTPTPCANRSHGCAP
jgi:hypothetical protein